MSGPYEPAEYWDRRLTADRSLRGTGHLSYSEGYNRWLYRAKGVALRKALAPLRPPLSALDVGSGVGWVVDQLLRWGASVEGCDISPSAVRSLSGEYPAVTFFEADLGSVPLPRPDGCYDLVTILDVTYHITDNQLWQSAVSDLARVVRPGGVVIVLDAFGDMEQTPAEHVRFRTRRDWDTVAVAAGLQMEALIPAYRWLSRDVDQPGWRHLPGWVRGAGEFALERMFPRRAHMCCARFRHTGS